MDDSIQVKPADTISDDLSSQKEHNPHHKWLVASHPCYDEKAHFKISRLHLPVARACNIKCNFCDRKISQFYHTSRPGATYRILTPKAALDFTRDAIANDPKLAVVGIAGPGEPLFNPETFETLSLIGDHFSDIQLCVCTNGLLLPEKIEELVKYNVSSVSVTLNTIDRSIAAKIYRWVNYNGTKFTGEKAGEIMIRQQLDGIAKAVKLGVRVKVNTVLIPSINERHISAIATKLADLKVNIMNIMPLIPLSEFATLTGPSCEQLNQARAVAEKVIPQFRLCKQCRADAYGIPGCE